ncbi:hypothetical protein ACCQ13_05275 [Xanthomonas sp. NCPPB 1638]|uniref:Uncharacterized protein n=1 Tax=Xanthomonas cucurbitae TaxID=56453 RepID=A0A2S7DX18_9XANT|nr:hypothetical protein [Xanthomonas cucurbitae]PPU78289.1 hypothetical protein XcuCFBP2542_02885 [Xanthomonas cucurbitae]QHG88998.1 hypothetical protein EBN15_05255 [Xanthomonas cucurbitae]WDM76406.1 hypothetical protein K6982_05220 [Xanthomonas cucurbitae]WDM78140.1 hypothetical protein K6980_13205 [Xanthomonas cucurbitae]WDM81820.1 hypothetical protein K6979_13210 [Xanthomonas cucurbitae]
MPFLYNHRTDAPQGALHAAAASHGAAALRVLLTSDGNRAIAGALSTLFASDRGADLCHLPCASRNRLCEAEGLPAQEPLPTRSAAAASPLFLLW